MIGSWMKQRVRVIGRNIYWGIRGRSFVNPDLPAQPTTVLYICKGNICRSPFAEHVSVSLAERMGFGGITFASAGFEVTEPRRPPSDALATANGFGIVLAGHRSRRLTPELVSDSDLLVVMEADQLLWLRRTYRAHSGKMILLPLLDPDRSGGAAFRFNIDDPYGREPGYYQNCFERISRCVEVLLGSHVRSVPRL